MARQRKKNSLKVSSVISWIITIPALVVALVAGLVLGIVYAISNTHGRQFVRWMMKLDIKDAINWTRTSPSTINNHVQLGTPDVFEID